MANNRNIVHGHVNRVTGTTQTEINNELAKFFIDVQPDHPLYDVLKTEQLELNKGILVINNNANDPSIYIKNTLGDVVKISGNGSLAVEEYKDAVIEASAENLGQIIFVKNDSVYDNQTYYTGPYIVIGEGELMKLSMSLASGDADVDTEIAGLKISVGELNSELDKKVDIKSGYSLVSDSDITKLQGIETNAQANVIEKIIVNGEELPVTDKTVAFTVSVDNIEGVADGRVENVYIDEVDGVKYLVLTFTEAAQKEDIMVDVSEMFTEQYSSGDGISLENQIIGIRLGENETILAFDENGSLVIAETFKTRISEIENILSVITDTISGHTEELASLSETVSGNTEELANLSMVVSGYSEELASLSETVSGNTDSISAISGETSSLKLNMNNLKPQEVENYATAVQRATANNVGQIFKTKKDSEYNEVVYLEGFYLVEGEGKLSYIVSADGTQDELKVLADKIEEQGKAFNEKTEAIDAYTVNGYTISQENGVVLEGKDIVLDETLEEASYTMDSIVMGDNVNTAVRKIENTLGATVIAMTASLNDINSQVNWAIDTTVPVEGTLTIKPNTLHVIEEPVSNLTLTYEETEGEVAYRYSVLFKTSDTFGTISLPADIILSNIPIADLETNTNYLLEIQHNFAKWTKMIAL